MGVAETGEVKTEEQRDPEQEARRRLALAQIRQYPDPVLRMRAREVDTFDDNLVRLAERMRRLMRDAAGVGLAATQVGVLRRLFVFQLGSDDEEAEDQVAAARELLVPPKPDTAFGRRYLSLMQREPALVMAHSSLAKLL